MKFSHFFIDRPIFAAVISIVITLVGIVGYVRLPVTQYPDVVPPSITVTVNYPGASPEILMDTAIAPLEQEINGVENMMYMSSQCNADGSATITVTFEVGTNIDSAQVLVQNKIAIAEPRLPEEVRSIGVTVKKRSPDMLVVANLYSPDGSRDKLYLTNYAITQMKDRLARVFGVSDINIFGAREYSMRVWLNPDRLSHFNMTASQVVASLREQNKQVAAGKLNQPPFTNPNAAYDHLKKLLQQAGLPSIRFHDLRHTFATHALASGVDAKTLSGILGHTQASFTLDTYTHVTGDMQKRASEIVGGFMENIMVR